MDSFRWLSVTLSILLGLGVTRLLSRSSTSFVRGPRRGPDWVPLTWAGCIFLWQIQYWWAIEELPSLVKVWTMGSFLILVGLALLLFAAASLILAPAGSARAKLPRRNSSATVAGRWSPSAPTSCLALVTDWLFWGVSPLSRWGVLPGGTDRPSAGRRLESVEARGWKSITVLYVPLSIAAILELSPAAY